MTTSPPEGLDKLRNKFAADKIGKLPKVTCKACSDAQSRVCGKHAKSNCAGCGSYITSAHLHLDYVGHAEVTRRFLDADPQWTWEPLAFDSNGMPAQADGGLWIKLTICGVTRLGFGDAQGKKGPNAVKEMIGDALRNAGLRFGVALDLWSKEADNVKDETPADYGKDEDATDYETLVDSAQTVEELSDVGKRIAAAHLTPTRRQSLRQDFQTRMAALREVAA